MNLTADICSKRCFSVWSIALGSTAPFSERLLASLVFFVLAFQVLVNKLIQRINAFESRATLESVWKALGHLLGYQVEKNLCNHLTAKFTNYYS